MLKIDLHTHSIASGHALNTVYEMARVAKKKGIQVLGIADHASSMEGAPHQGYFWISDKLTELDGVEIFMGSEVNIINKEGKIDLEDSILQKQRVVIAGIHDKTPYRGISEADHTTAIVNAMRNKYVRIVSHPFRAGFKINMKKLVDAAGLTQTLLELNNQAFENESSSEEFLEAYRELIQLSRKLGLPVIIGSDAHTAGQIGEDEYVMKAKSIIGLTDNMIINNRKEDLKNFLKSDKGRYRF